MTEPVNNISLKTGITQAAKDNLLYQFKDLPNINKLVGVFTEELQQIETEVLNLLVLRTIETAEGVQLDNIGAVMGVVRKSLDDDSYRNIIKIRNVRRTGTGTVESTLKLLQLFTNDITLHLYQGKEYFVNLTFNDYCNPLAADLETLRTFFPVVTDLRVVINLGIPFGFEGDDAAEGFGSVHDPLVGGEFSSRLQ